jgi:telomere length regulation protein
MAPAVLDGCLEVDGGRADHTTLVLVAGEWAGMVLARLEKGARIVGSEGAQEVKLKRAAAGVLLKMDELWRKSMVDIK